MKILLIHTLYQQSGGEDAVVQQESVLLKQEHHVEVLYFQNKAGLNGALQFLLSLCNILAVQKVKQKIKEFKPDVVHLHNWHFASGPWIIRTIKKYKIPIVHSLHNYRLICPSAILLHNNKLFLNSLTEKFPWTSVKNAVYRNSYFQTFWLAFVVWFHKKIGTWSMVDYYICLTEAAKSLFIQSSLNIAVNKFFVKPNFIESVENINDSKREEHYLFIGRLSEEKGISCLLEAFRNSSYQLRIAGEGPMKNMILDFCSRNKNVTYLGYLSNERKFDEYKMAQALIFPSIWHETFGLVAIEGFSVFTPVIASNLGSMSSIILDGVNGFHFAAGDPESLKKVLTRFSTLPEEEKKRMQQNAFTTYNTLYSADKQMAYFGEIYNKAVLCKEK